MAQVRVATGIDIEYEVQGTGAPMLLVMGLGGQLVSWPAAFVVGLIDRGFQVITFDNRDVGLSGRVDAPTPGTMRAVTSLLSRRMARPAYRIADMAADALGLLDALGIPHAHLVGTSMGGMIAQEMAIAAPHRVLSLASIMSTPDLRSQGRPRTSLLVKLRRMAADGSLDPVERELAVTRLLTGSTFGDDEAENRVLIEMALARGDDAGGIARQAAAVVGSPDRTGRLHLLRVPTLVVHGLKDPLVRFAGGVATVRAVPDARLVAFSDMGHGLPGRHVPAIVDHIVDNAARHFTAV
jgi:pimeloyl-ACP methyl ester carboxylesterase